MADTLINLLEQNPTTGIAVGGALVAAAVGLTAAKALGGKTAPAPVSAPKKKKSKTKAKKKAAAAPQDKENTPAEDINLEDFVDDGPDSEEEEAIRAEKLKLKRKQKKKNAKAKAKAASSPVNSAVDQDKEKEKKKAAAAAAKQDVEDGWETVSRKKVTKPKQQ
ncbi:hypothetical protein PHYBOEH_006662 [Phytophthora boehmeriae]|uniref:Uncharacterized protein n=1 Tax=Phytophthora boehmeriae TaxID=109152 RepID=A0A8T1WBP5_9STRA|nr:hypothetical protein PHYBOEH_006662 [Phytophthora boehmeriae]